MKVGTYVVSIGLFFLLVTSSAQPTVASGNGTRGQPSGSDTTGAWSEFRGNPNSTGYSISRVPSTNRVFLRFDTGWPFHSSAVASGGILYFGSDSSKVYAVNISTGEQVWNYTTSSDVWATPLVAEGKVFIGSMDMNLYALDAVTGVQRWTFQANDSIVSSAKYVNGTIVFGAYDGNVYFVNATTGLQVSPPFRSGGQIWGTPAIVGDSVVFGSNDGKVYRISLESKTELWNFSLSPESSGFVKYSSPAVYNHRVFIGSNDRSAYSINLDSGQLVWKVTTGGFVYSSPGVHDNTVFVHSTDGNLYALPFDDPDGDKNISSAEVLWQFPTGDGGGGEGGSSPAIADGKVLVSSRPGRVFCINGTTGQQVWSFSTARSNFPSFSSPAVADGRVYVGLSDGVMYGFSQLTPGMRADIAPAMTVIESQRAMEIVFNVTYGGKPVEGAFVNFAVSQGVLSQSGASTLGDGKQRVKYLAPKVSQNATVTITAKATKFGMEDATRAVQITIVPAEEYGAASGSGFSLEKYQVPLFVIAVLIIANVFVYLLNMTKRRRRSTE